MPQALNDKDNFAEWFEQWVTKIERSHVRCWSDTGVEDETKRPKPGNIYVDGSGEHGTEQW